MTNDFNLQEYFSLRADAIDERLDSVLVTLERFNVERDRRYEARFEAQEKSIAKAENAQKEYNINHNDLMRQMSEQAKMFISHGEHDIAYRNLVERVDRIQIDLQLLREHQSVIAGKESKGLADQARNQWVIGILIGAISVAFSIVTFMILNVTVK